MKYKAFISYRHSENGRRHAVALETALKRYAKPTLARPIKIFRDEKHMKPDINLPKLIQDGLENSEYLIFLAEKASANSPWCCEELELWCNPQKLNRVHNLIIVLIDDVITINTTKNIDFSKTTALPELLQTHISTIPLYVDLRWAKTDNDTNLSNSKYRFEINALSAKFRNLNPEDLNDEEIKTFRQNIRLRNTAIGILIGLLVVSVGTAWWAVKQQKIAESKTLEVKLSEKKIKDTFLIYKLIEGKKENNLSNDNIINIYNPLDEAIEKCKQYKFLHLDNMGLEEIPTEIFKLTELEVLNLNNNKLKELPPDFCHLINLKILSLNGNDTLYKSNTLFRYLLCLNNLTKLSIGSWSNKLLSEMDTIVLSDSIWNIPNLKTFEIASIRLGRLSLQGLRNNNLDTFSVVNCDIKILPPSISYFKNLRSLNLRDNGINELPKEIGELSELSFLDLRGNALKELPSTIMNLRKLKTIFLDYTSSATHELDANFITSIITTAYPNTSDFQRKLIRANHMPKRNSFNIEYVQNLRKSMPWCNIIYTEKTETLQDAFNHIGKK